MKPGFNRIAALGVALLGAILAGLPSSVFSRLSYELPFFLKHEIKEEVLIVYLDDETLRRLNVPSGGLLDRSFYASLLERLSLARVVAFDLVFSGAGEAEADRRFREALQQPPPVALAARLVDRKEGLGSTRFMEWPERSFIEEAEAVGLIALRPTPSGIHQVYEAEKHPSLSWETARLLDAPATREPEARLASERWLNYYGPSGGRHQGSSLPGAFPNIGLSDALIQTNLFFKDKIVFVGSNFQLDSPNSSKDAFDTPYSARSGMYAQSPGVDIHATAALNLLHDEWLVRVPLPLQAGFCLAFGLAFYAWLARLSPFLGLLASLGVAVVVIGISAWTQLSWHVWWSWLVPLAAQAPAAFALTTGHHYTSELFKRRRYRAAFAAYLSPYLADQVAARKTDLSLGGELTEITILFTDLQGFTALSEKLPPQEVSEILTTYFNRTTTHILDNGGTITKYIGDAVMAIWGAPVPDDGQADHAVQAALGVIEAGERPIADRQLITRIGVHSGPALVGNLGSDFRFDYTAIGDNVNLASRLEGLNKLFGSRILISDATRQRLTQAVPLRRMGRIVVAGKVEPVELHQVLSPRSAWKGERLQQWETALGLFAKREFGQARRILLELEGAEESRDPSISFYIDQINRIKSGIALPDDWQGEVVVDAK